MHLYIIRHTPVAVPSGTCYGSSDVALSSDWREHLERVRRKLPLDELTEHNLYSSPLTRCATLARELGPAPTFDDRLKEMDYGDWEGKSWSEIDPDQRNAWIADFEGYRTPNGESLGDVYLRATQCISEIAKSPHQIAFVVTHGALIRCLVAYGMGLSLNNAGRMQIDYGGVSRLMIDGERKQVESMNV